MKWVRFFLPLVLASGAFAQAAAQEALVKQYCVGCHNNKLKTAGLSLEGLDLSKVSGDADTWEKVLRKVSANQMPPAGLPHPTGRRREGIHMLISEPNSTGPRQRIPIRAAPPFIG